MSGVLRIGHRVGTAVRDFLYPPVCLFCRKPAGDEQIADRFCADCEANLLPNHPDSCERCAAPIGPHLDTSDGCVHCRGERFAFERVIALGVYEGALRDVCGRGKTATGRPVIGELGRRLGEQIRESGSSDFDWVVPVPRHWWDRVRQDHNPSETLAASVVRSLSVPHGRPLLRKRRRLVPQRTLPPGLRRKNPRGAFGVSPGCAKLVNGRNLLLVDDVLTTGATADACARSLRKAGASHVTVAVVARGIGR